jgi:hypothetical protein
METGMKYREVSRECVHDCGRLRRPGQRECSVCHAATMRQYRLRQTNELARLRIELARLRDENQKLRREVEAL